MARKKINLKEELLKRKTFSIPEIQKELSVGYKELRNCVSEMEKTGHATLADDGLNYIVDTQPAPKKSNGDDRSSSKQHSQTVKSFDIFDLEDEDDDDEEDSYDDIIARRRRELMERLARMSEMDEDEDDDEEEDEDDDAEDEEADENTARMLEEACERLKIYSSQADDCKLINDINYAEEKLNAQKIVNRLSGVGYKLTLKAIQYGTSSIGYVFGYPSQKKDINDLNNFADDIKSVINADKVMIIAPWNDTTVYVLVKHDALFDPLCKRVLQYWVMRNGGRASIASVQRGLGIGFNRAGKIMDHLQKFGCVEQLSPTDDVSKPVHVKINLQEINILFPKSLGWD